MADAVIFLDGHAAGGEPSVAHAAAHACTIGRRKGMEDALVVAGSFRGNPGEDLYAVFDGFAGSEVSAAASELFPGMLAAELDAADAVGAGQDVAGGNDDDLMFGFDDMGGGGGGGGGGGEADDAFADALEDFDVDSEVVGARHLVLPEGSTVDVAAVSLALIRAFKAFSLHARSMSTSSGSTALVVYVVDGVLFVANSGDTRAVLRREGERLPLRLSVDHKPDSERDRLNNSGAEVTTVPGSVPRVNGGLAVSRGFLGGAADFNRAAVIWTPHVGVHVLEPRDSCIILASDGLWDKVSDRSAVMIAKSELNVPGSPWNDRLAAACQSLVEQAYSAHSLDNISVICVTPLACDMVREEEAEAGAEATA